MRISRTAPFLAALMAVASGGSGITLPRSTGPGAKPEPQDDRTTRRMKLRAEAKRFRKAEKRRRDMERGT